MAADNLNKNMLSPTGFTFTINKTPGMNFFVQSVALPGINLPFTEQPTPFKKIPVYGDHIDYGELQVTFKINEDMSNYREIFNWITAVGFPDEFTQYSEVAGAQAGSGQGIYSDASLVILSSAKNGNIKIDIFDMFPTSLSDINMDVRDTEIAYLEATATFKFSNYRFSDKL